MNTRSVVLLLVVAHLVHNLASASSLSVQLLAAELPSERRAAAKDAPLTSLVVPPRRAAADDELPSFLPSTPTAAYSTLTGAPTVWVPEGSAVGISGIAGALIVGILLGMCIGVSCASKSLAEACRSLMGTVIITASDSLEQPRGSLLGNPLRPLVRRSSSAVSDSGSVTSKMSTTSNVSALSQHSTTDILKELSTRADDAVRGRTRSNSRVFKDVDEVLEAEQGAAGAEPKNSSDVELDIV